MISTGMAGPSNIRAGVDKVGVETQAEASEGSGDTVRLWAINVRCFLMLNIGSSAEKSRPVLSK